MLNNIAFGNKEFIGQLLQSALEDIRSSKTKLTKHRDLPKKTLFSEVHNLKTTLSMLEASEHIQSCQLILDGIQDDNREQVIESLDQFLLSLSEIENAVEAEIERR